MSSTMLRLPRKRATLVCVRCHAKKIRCDLKSAEAGNSCTGCLMAASECCVRVAKRKGPHRKETRADVVQGASGGEFVCACKHSSTTGFHTCKGLPHGRQRVIESATSIEADQSVEHANSQHDAATLSVAVVAAMPQPSAARGLTGSVRRDQMSYFGESGLMRLLSDSDGQAGQADTTPLRALGGSTRFEISPLLKKIFAETYKEYCYPWCPVVTCENLLENPAFSGSATLMQSLALLGSTIRPPPIQHASQTEYYERFKILLYGNQERNPLVRIIAIVLIYWWSAEPPNLVSMDSQYWWTSIAIRLAQEIGLHTEPAEDYVFRDEETLSLRRRIWWTLFARERLTAICHGRPCIIHPEDCSIRKPTLKDFPEAEAARAEVFVEWVRLCETIGKVSKYLAKRTSSDQFPTELACELARWTQSLPQRLQLAFSESRTASFSRDIHQLHLPYLAAIILLYMTPSSNSVPTADATAILAASSIARISEDLLTYSSMKFLPGMAGWYMSIAVLALLHARQVECAREAANREIDTLMLSLQAMAKLWHSSAMFVRRLNKLVLQSPAETTRVPLELSLGDVESQRGASSLADLTAWNGLSYQENFPFASAETSELFRLLLNESNAPQFSLADWNIDLSLQMYDLFGQPLSPFEYRMTS